MKKILLVFFFSMFLLTCVKADSYSLQMRFIVPDTNAPTFDNLRNLTGYTNQYFSRYITATDDVAVDCFSLNDTSVFQVDCSGRITNSITLDTATIYYLNLSVNDTSGNLNWGEFYINITSLTSSGTSNICRYLKYGYFNDWIPFFKEPNCVVGGQI